LADLFEMLLIILWLIGLQATGGMSTLLALAVILSTYLGRIILVRLHQIDLSRLIFLVLIWYLTGWFCLLSWSFYTPFNYSLSLSISIRSLIYLTLCLFL
jgi:hypothetical protein